MNYAEQILKEYMEIHGLFEKGWNYSFNDSERYSGFTYFTKKKIKLSNVYINNPNTTREQIKNTVLHEIAHALVGKKHQHDEIWRKKALSLGCDGKIRTKSFKNYENKNT